MAEGQDKASLAVMRGGTLGRYVVLSLLGKGGMGIVYAAYDPELDRKVAVKLLHVADRGGSRGNLIEKRTRLLREAKAIARLSHPNVVTVYDVGTIGDQVFVAMELVDGVTVTRWRELIPRTWKEVLAVFVAAGEALAAAHAAGLVHRDFKPDNVMVGRDGKVRVMDFGLARQVERQAEDATPETVEPDPDSEPTPTPPERVAETVSGPESRLTDDGVVVGTPAYMPPEQYMGKSDARTDQFSFCVALYECLYGQYPFPGKTPFGLTGSAAAGHIRAAPPHTRVPMWLRKVVLRGIRARPDERYPRMEDLLAALRRDPAAVRRRWALVAGLLLAFTTVGFVARQAADSRLALCAAGPSKVAAAWELPADHVEGARHQAVRRAFIATGKRYAEDALRGVSRALDDYASRWVALYRESCEATRLHGDQSEEVLDLRTACLNNRLTGFKALTDLFADATGEVVERAVDAARALTPLDGCSDVRQLRALIPPPNASVRSRVESLRRELTSIKALHDAGRFAEALKRLHLVAAEARVLEYRPLIAEVMTRIGLAQLESNDNVASEVAYDEAFEAALASHHDDLIAEISANLVWAIGFQERFKESEWWMRVSEAALDRVGAPDPVLYSWLLNNVSTVLALQSRYAEALEYSQKALALKEGALGTDNPDVAITVGNISLMLSSLGRGKDALAANERALRILRFGLGNSHPRVADQLNNRGEILTALGKLEDALSAYQAAREIFEREFGQHDPSVAYALTGVGSTLLNMGEPRQAVELLERALHIRERQDPDPGRLAETGFALARALWETGTDRSRALTLGRNALEASRRAPLSRGRTTEIAAWVARGESKRRTASASR